MAMMNAQPCEYTKNYLTVYFKEVIIWYVNYASINLLFKKYYIERMIPL